MLSDDLKNRVFGRLLVIEKSDIRKRDGMQMWKCQCDCGSIKDVSAECLKRGRSRSCGCLNIERSRETNKTHGGRNLPEYNIWQSMKWRCLNPRNKDYPRYGARNIKVCDRWIKSFSD